MLLTIVHCCLGIATRPARSREAAVQHRLNALQLVNGCAGGVYCCNNA